MSRLQRRGLPKVALGPGMRGVWTAIGFAMALSLPSVSPPSAQAQSSDDVAPIAIAVGVSEPGHVELITRLVKRYNTRDGAGEIDTRHTVSIVPVDDMETAMVAVERGRADLALASIHMFNTNYGIDEGFARPIAVEALTIATRRARLVRDPRQLRGLDVEIPAERSEWVLERMNQVLSRFGISMPAGSFASSGNRLEAENDPFLRLCQLDYDVRVDMVIHPFPAFDGALPCELRLMSFPDMPPVTDMGPGVMRYQLASETYDWLNQDITSLGAAVGLVQPEIDEASIAGRDRFIAFVDGLSPEIPGLLSAFEADLWMDRIAVDDPVVADEGAEADTAQESVE